MKHIIVLTKPYNNYDFAQWYKYHKACGWTIHIIDNSNDSKSLNQNQEIMNKLDLNHGDTYERIIGWPNQWKLFDEILNKNKYAFKDNEIVAFIDDDEYLWFYMDYWRKIEEHQAKYKGKKYESIEDYIERSIQTWNSNAGEYFINDIVLVPQILLSTPFLHASRGMSESLLDFSVYRRNDISAQGKAIIKYHEYFEYCFDNDTAEKGHTPFVKLKNGEKDAERKSLVNGSAISTTTYGAVDPSSCLRLYHYHIKSLYDWKKKFERGSAAVDHQWYDENIRKNKNYGNYTIPDFTMMEMKKLLEI